MAGRPRDGIAEALAARLAEVLTPASVIVGVGNELRGDDAAGLAVARRLAGAGPWEVVEAQTAPENFLMKIVARCPDCVLVVDCLDFGAAPGSIELFGPESIAGLGPSTHGPAPLAFLELLRMMHPCRVLVLGIQPAQTAFGQPLAPPVASAVETIAQAFGRLSGRPAATGDGPGPSA